MDCKSKRKQLYALAEQDNIYCVWKKSYEDCALSFKEFANEQPEEIQKILWSYTQCGQMMLQRIINIACDKMEFMDDIK